jgi:hypothetical protein
MLTQTVLTVNVRQGHRFFAGYDRAWRPVMVSRVFVIVLALGAAVYRFASGAVPEAVGLIGLASGLLFLRAAERQPSLKRYAYLSFLMSALIIVYVIYRDSR